MTGRGNLAYYLASWVCGCFFTACAFWLELQFSRNASLQGTFQSVSFLGLCFFGLIFGAGPSLLFAWILRRIMQFIRIGRIWLWIVIGAGLSYSLIGCLGKLGHLAQDPRYLPYSALPIWPFLLVGPLAIMEASLWMVVPVGAITAAVLFAVYQAFEQQAEL